MSKMQFRALLLLSAGLLYLSCLCGSYKASDPYQDELQPQIQAFVEHQHIAGLSIAIVKDDKLVYAHGFGLKDIRKTGEPITPESLFHIASITKTFVATSVMQLVESGKVQLDKPVLTYLPYFKLADERYKTVTVYQFLTHTSGMPDVTDYEWDKPQSDDGALERYVRSLGNLKLEFEPGTRFKYSNIAYEVLGDLIAKVSGQTFEDYVQQHLLTPLDMKDSTLLLSRANPKLLTWGHELEHRNSGDVVPSKVFPFNRIHSPSSDLFSNVTDLTHWAVANMDHGEWHGKRILKASTYNEMWKPQHQISADHPESGSVGISWFLEEYKGHQLVFHSGSDVGYLTYLVMIPDQHIAVIWLTNCKCWRGYQLLTHAALDTALGLKPEIKETTN